MYAVLNAEGEWWYKQAYKTHSVSRNGIIDDVISNFVRV